MLAQTLKKERADAQEKLEKAVEECEASHQAQIVTLQTRVKVAEDTLASAVKAAVEETQRKAKEAAAKVWFNQPITFPVQQTAHIPVHYARRCVVADKHVSSFLVY